MKNSSARPNPAADRRTASRISNKLTGVSFSLALKAVLLCAVLAVRSHAQQITGTFTGTIRDNSGALIPNALITATSAETGQTKAVKSSNDGEYRIDYLSVGHYTVQATAPGFRTSVQKNLLLTIDQTQRVDMSLEVGAQQETVTVSTTPPLLNLSTSEVSRVVQPEEILGLPLVNRNVYQELTLTPGVLSSSSTNGSSANFVLGLPVQQTSINGQSDTAGGAVSYYLDGGLNMNGERDYGNPVPNPDAIQEFRVETNNYSAQYGRYSSGVISVITRSGTNQYHGSLFEFVRNTAFNAKPWNSLTNPPYHRNQFGGTVGGKIIPNRSFFFFSYAGLRQTTSTFVSGAVVPTTLERSGNFSQSAIKPIDPNTGLVYAYNGTPGWIPPTALDLTATSIINNYIPLANAAGNQWTGNIPSPFDTDEYLGKLNHKLSSKDQLDGSFFTIKTANTYFAGGNLPWSLQTSEARQVNANLSDTHVFGPSLINQVWLTYVRVNGGRIDSPTTSLGDLGSDYTIQGPKALPQIAVSGYFTLGQSFAGPKDVTNFYSPRDVVTKTAGPHALNFGAEMSLDKDELLATLQNYGIFSFATSNPVTTKNALADFVTGRPASMQQATPVTTSTNSWYYGFFLQDNYRATQRLTLNLGLRYDFETPKTDPQNKELTFIPGRQSTVSASSPVGILFPGDSGVPRGIMGMRFHHVSPRVGLAFDVFGDGKTSLRAAAGIFYGSISGNEWSATGQANPFAAQQTFNSIASLTHVYSNPASFPTGDPFPYYYSPASPRYLASATIAGNALNFQNPCSYQVNTSLQQQLSGDLALTVAYVGSFIHNVPFQTNLNYPAYVPGATTSQASINSRRPYDQGVLGTIGLYTSSQTGSYNALQVSANKRMSQHFMINGFYVWSKTFWSATPGGYGPVQDYTDLRAERGPADQDLQNMASMSGMWDISYYRGSRKLIRNLLDGWQISPIITLNSGLPLNIVTGTTNNAGETNTNRPNLALGQIPRLDPHRPRPAAAAQWFNTAAFVPNSIGAGRGPYGIDGNTPRDFLRDPGYRDVDLGILRTFELFEGLKLEARGEAINAFNFVNLSPPNATLSSSAFGKITSANATREIQVGARLIF